MAPDEISDRALLAVSQWQRNYLMSDYRDTDQCALRSLKRDLPAVAYPEKDSLLHFILQTLGWREEHCVEASVPDEEASLRQDGPYVQFVKMINPSKE